ncbi:MAG: aminopeptidase [Bacteroidales bacterium]|nr:aminopeptidase [Bacteroidales bacterium]
MGVSRFLLSVVSISFTVLAAAQEADFEGKLASLPGVVRVSSVDSDKFSEKYELVFEQFVDPVRPELGKFNQTVYLGHVHPDSVTVVVTEGYNADYAAKTSYRDELSDILNANNVVIEHRYFNGSVPDNPDWTYLTTANAAADHHSIVTALKSIYGGKWVSTGISKGGQTCAMYRYYYPGDVDVTVPYVAPFCRALEDGRHEPFIAEYCGDPEIRERIQNFQKECLIRRDALQPLMDSLCTAQKLEFNLPTDQIFDYCVLESSFALWQWHSDIDSVPSTDSSDKTLFDFLMKVSGPDYFSKGYKNQPFHVQAAKELGYYGYSTEPFEGLLHIESAHGYHNKLFLPDGFSADFDNSLYENMCSFFKTTDENMLFIYGQFDPWSSVGAQEFDNGRNIRVFTQPDGSHRARVRTFSEEKQKEIISIIKGWLYE